jgi:hypothetical protein
MAAASPARIGEPPVCHSDRSPFGPLETTFRLLVVGPQPLSLNGRSIGLTAQSIRLWELRAILSTRPPALPCSAPRWLRSSDELVGVAGRGWLALPAYCCPACGSGSPASRWAARTAEPALAAWSSPTCLTVWTRRTRPVRASPRRCCGPWFDLPLAQTRPREPGPAWRLFPEAPGEPLPHGRGGRRVAECLGELGLQA